MFGLFCNLRLCWGLSICLLCARCPMNYKYISFQVLWEKVYSIWSLQRAGSATCRFLANLARVVLAHRSGTKSNSPVNTGTAFGRWGLFFGLAWAEPPKKVFSYVHWLLSLCRGLLQLSTVGTPTARQYNFKGTTRFAKRPL